MYSGFVGTVISHLCSLTSTLWAILQIAECDLQNYKLKKTLHMVFVFTILNSCLALVRYGNSNFGYKLIPYHVMTLNLSAIMGFTMLEMIFYMSYIQHSTAVTLDLIFSLLPILNLIAFYKNISSKYYRVRLKWSDAIIAINGILLILKSMQYENYHAVALGFSYLFAYFVIGETSCVFDTELPAIDAFQYLVCFLNYFTVHSFCL